jgi:dipeptidyl-peptidase-4
VIDPLTEGATQLTKGDFDLYPIKLSKDGKWMLARAQAESLSRNDIYRVGMEDGKLHRLSRWAGNYGDPETDDNLERAAMSFNSWEKPLAELFILDAKDGGGETQVTQSHREGFDKLYKIKPKLFTYKNRNGQTIWGYMYLPPNWSKSQKRPLMIDVYGGPLTTGKSVVEGGVSLFQMWRSYAMGYIGVTIDPRGQSGYGAVFGNANWDAPGKAQVEDLSDGVKWLIENYNVDPAKVGVNGWSFGGFQTQMCMYTAPDVFTLGIAGAGPTEWQNYNNWYSGGVIGDSRTGKPEDLDKYSLTNLAKNLRSPLMLLHGVEDTNVLFQDTVKVYRKLLQYGKGGLVELVIDPTGGHGMGGDMSGRDHCSIFTAFLLKHWGVFKP